MSSFISINNLSFEFPNGNALFERLNLTIPFGKVALVGSNGTGKSTLAKLIVGDYKPRQGGIVTKGSIDYFEQSCKPPKLTVQEYLGFDYSWDQKSERLIINIDKAQFCHNLSPGEWSRVRLAKVANSRFIIFDEPTNHLDSNGLALIMDFIKNFSGGLLLISHYEPCLSLCSSFIELTNQGFETFTGEWCDFLEHSELKLIRNEKILEQAKKNYKNTKEKQQQSIERQEKRSSRGKRESRKGGVPKILLGGLKNKSQKTTSKINIQSLNRKKAALQNAKLAYDELISKNVIFSEMEGTSLPGKKPLIEVQNFNIKYSNWIYKTDLNFIMRGDSRVVLKGDNGSGKSSFLQAIAGKKMETRGSIKVAPINKIYISQGCEFSFENKSLLSNFQYITGFPQTDIRNHLARFLFFREQVYQSVSSLSGGERLRAALALGFLLEPNPSLLILDEPTNNLDIENIKFIESILRRYVGALLVVSHDETFIKNSNIQESFILE